MLSRLFVAIALAALALAGAASARAQSAARGEVLYQTYCMVCHGLPPVGGPERAANDPARIRAAASGGVPAMSIVNFLSGTQLADIAAWIAQILGVGGPPPANYTALWWNPNESGWGINLNHQGDIIFGTLFTYDAGGSPLWLVMPAGALQSGSTYSGELYRTTGPAFDANPFTPIGAGNLTLVGTMTVAFSGDNAATLTYTFNGTPVAKSIQRQVYGTRAAHCSTITGSRAALANYQDLWWVANGAESGWGVNVTHQDNILFATLFTYDANRVPLWLVMSNGAMQSDGVTFTGDLYRTTGPAFNANPFTPIGAGNLTVVGTMRFRFTNGESGSLTYTVNGVAVTKAITRQVFANPVPQCQ